VLEAARLRDERPDCRQSYLPLVATLIYLVVGSVKRSGLCWEDVDLLAGTVSIRHTMGRDGVLGAPKTKAGTRVVPIADALLRVLLDHNPRTQRTRTGSSPRVTARGRSAIGTRSTGA